MENKLEAALRYAAEGYHVFPCWPGTKEPMCAGGFHAATADPDQIRAWFTATPDANLGWSLHPSGLGAVDLDRGYDPADVADLTPTRTVKTPSGGRHMIYAGEIPSTQGKLGKHIDTRGKGGYTLLPPSVIDARDKKAAKDPTRCGPYTWEDENQWIDAAPTSVVEKLAKPKVEPQRAAPDVELDHPRRVALVQGIAALAAPAVEGEGSQLPTIKLANALLDISSPDTVFDALLEHWAPRCTFTGEDKKTVDEWLHARVFSLKPGTASRKSDFGCMTDEEVMELYFDVCVWPHLDHPEPPREPIIYGFVPTPPPGGWPQRKRFPLRDPEQDAGLPPLTYYDADNTMPRIPGDGAVLVVVGPKSSHKTGLVIKKCLDAVEKVGSKVLYLALEGAHGIRTIRLPLARQVRNMPWETLREHWRTETGFNLFSENDRAALIAALKEDDFKPDIIVVDTLTKAVGGQDINTPSTGQDLHTLGDQIAAEFGALLIMIHHPGKSGTTLGSTLIEALAYAVWHVSRDGDAVKCWVEKMKDGPAEFTVNYRIDGLGGVPFIRDETPEEKKTRAPAVSLLRRAVLDVLRERPGEVIPATKMLTEINCRAGDGKPIGKAALYDQMKKSTRNQKPCLLDLVARDRFGNPQEPLSFVYEEISD